jgi:hypothetical protein
MRERGGFIGVNANPAVTGGNSAAGGMWTLREAEELKRAGTWPRLLLPRLDVFSGEVAAYGCRRLSSTYTGPLIEVRRSSDNATDTFTEEQIVNGSLVSWVGAGNNGFVKTFYDQSGNGVNLTQSTNANQPQIVSSGSLLLDSSNPSILLDGTSDELVGNAQSQFAFGTGDFVLEFWVRPTTVSGIRIFFDFRTSGDGPGGGVGRINMATVDGNVVWYIFNAIRIQSTTAISANTWSHLCVSRSGSSTRMFINGVQEGVTWTDNTNYTVGAGSPRLGRNHDDTAGSILFAGYIDQIVMATNTSRTSAFTPPDRNGLA